MPPRKTAKKKAPVKQTAPAIIDEVLEAAGITPEVAAIAEASAIMEPEQVKAPEAEDSTEEDIKEIKKEAPVKIEMPSDAPKCPICGTIINENTVRFCKKRPDMVKIYFDCPVCKTDRIAKVRK